MSSLTEVQDTPYLLTSGIVTKILTMSTASIERLRYDICRQAMLELHWHHLCFICELACFMLAVGGRVVENVVLAGA